MAIDERLDEPESYGWLTEHLKSRVREVFESRYKRPLADSEVVLIAENLTGLMESFLKMKWGQKYGNDNALHE